MWKNKHFTRATHLEKETSMILIDENKEYVIKINNRYLGYDCHKREIFMLQLLNSKNFKWAPQLIGFDDQK